MKDTQKVWEAPKLVFELIGGTSSGTITATSENWSFYYAMS